MADVSNDDKTTVLGATTAVVIVRRWRRLDANSESRDG